MNWEDFKYVIVDNLSEDLLDKKYRLIRGKSDHLPPTFGHCYVASEAAYYLLGGKEEGWKAHYIKHMGGSHWFLKHKSGFILDLTADQFRIPVDYSKARGTGFLTKEPSKRAKLLIKRIAVSPAWKMVKLMTF